MAQPEPEACIVHFSHLHPLTLHHRPQPQQSCSGCKLKAVGWTYGCPSPCSYFLHLSCAKMPPQIHHPFDQHNHILTLLPSPVCPPGVFTCTACAKQGSGFSYHCSAASCNFHLHITCASMPLTRTHPSHHHLLHLTFSPPYPNRSFSCDICGNLGSNQWLYRCHSCEFDAHLSCALKKPVAPVSTPLQQPLMQSYSTLPAQSPQAQNYRPPPQLPQARPYYPDQTRTTRHYQTDTMASATTHFQGLPCIFQSPTPTIPCTNGVGQPVGIQRNGQANALNLVVQGLFGGRQNFGQTVLQGLLGGGGGNADGGGGGGNDFGGGTADFGGDSGTGYGNFFSVGNDNFDGMGGSFGYENIGAGLGDLG
ncbi:uncharacterized protein LOC115753075 [Rhodamnia argentea]|uniref:Uncharacterized protein LOC115753075 n=1 Tax=Rhodamnia argentea TaxID=178133 RepID=A0A8B8QMG5_9MYRT|nr:uncharacterized protein LOC115753075 [Rhodamnia argentea]